jgi:hypothetical protein
MDQPKYINLGKVWADEMNGKVPAGTFREECFKQAKRVPAPDICPLHECHISECSEQH